MTSIRIAGAIDCEKLMRIADGLAVAVAVSLPLSTSATSILVGLWLLALVPTLSWEGVRRVLLSPSGGLPLLLIALGILGMIWADVSLKERWAGLDGFLKLLVIPLLIFQFERSPRGQYVFAGFLAACLFLLIASYVLAAFPVLPKLSPDHGVLVKNYVAQSAEFVLCAAVLAHVASDALRDRRWSIATAAAIVSAAFLFDVFFIATSRTTLVVVAVIVLIYAARRWGWRGLTATCVVGVIAASALWLSSSYLRIRVNSVLTEIDSFETQNARTSSGERITFWTKSIGFIREAPLIGHGTGSIPDVFRRAAVGKSDVEATATTNPHNQTFAVGIQLGLVGIAALWAMWAAHLFAFSGLTWVAWTGSAIVIQMLVGSVFNSYLFDFTEGWVYVFGVGVAAGMMRRRLRGQSSSTLDAGVR